MTNKQTVQNATFTRTLSEVLGVQTTEVTRVSTKTGNEYQATIVEKYPAIYTGIMEDVAGEDNLVKYTVMNREKTLKLVVKAPFINCNPLDTVVFIGLTGGALNNGAWFSAEDVKILKA